MNAYLLGVRHALQKLGGDIPGSQNPRITSQEELGQYLTNTYSNRRRNKAALYTSWSREEPALRNIDTENQGEGLQGGTSVRRKEPAEISMTPGPLIQRQPGIDNTGGGRNQIG